MTSPAGSHAASPTPAATAAALRPQRPYEDALRLGFERLSAVDPQSPGWQTLGVNREGDVLRLPLLGRSCCVDLQRREVLLEEAGRARSAWAILVLHYLCATDLTPDERQVSFSYFGDVGTYVSVFGKRIVGRFLATAGRTAAQFSQSSQQQGGCRVLLAGLAYRFDVLPRLPIVVIRYEGDEEMGPGANVIYRADAERLLPAEDRVVAAELLLDALCGKPMTEEGGGRANGSERRLYIAATSQNDGKTTLTLGLLRGFGTRAASVGFIKPVGQRFVTIDGQQIDEDTVLIKSACGLKCPLKDMSPVAIQRDFTRKFLDDPGTLLPGLEKSIRHSFAEAAKENDLVLIEGTGHAGVGSVFDLSNARVARLLDAKVIIVTPGGIGRPVDEITLNRTVFEKENVPVLGVIANKVLPDRLDQTHHYLSKALARQGLRLFGTIPFVPRLTWPTVEQIVDALEAKVLNGRPHLTNEVSEIVIGAMTPHNAVKYIRDKTLLIVPGDRDDVVLAAVTTDLLRTDIGFSGIILTGGLQLAVQTRELVMRTHIPVLAVDTPTYETAAAIHDITVKIRGTDEMKIKLASSLVQDHVDLDSVWQAL